MTKPRYVRSIYLTEEQNTKVEELTKLRWRVTEIFLLGLEDAYGLKNPPKRLIAETKRKVKQEIEK